MALATFVNTVRERWRRQVGSSDSFSLEARVFHSICIGIVLLLAVYIVYNFYSGLYVGSLSALVACVFFYWQFYRSRYHGKPHSNVAVALLGIVLFSVNYFTNAGINGSTDLIWPAYLLLVLAISPHSQHVWWTALYMIVFLVVHLVEYYYPSLVQYPFDMGKGRFIDRITAFPIPVVSIAIVIIFLKRSYVRQRRKVEEKAATIAHINEQLLEQKQQLQQSNAEKNKLLSIISHDMRAPLAHIQGYLQLLTQVEIGSTERMALERDLLTSTDQAVEMLSNLLYWSRSQMEGVTVNASAINLAATLHPTLEIEKTLAAQKQVRLQYHIGNNITVLADPDMLQLVVRNVVHNAIKFTHSGGWIHIEASTQGNECKLTIADNGMGIDAGKQKRIFSMTSGSTFGTNNEKGVGLGLPLCKEFMELQGGRIEVDSTPGEGSRFYVYVPLG